MNVAISAMGMDEVPPRSRAIDADDVDHACALWSSMFGFGPVETLLDLAAIVESFGGRLSVTTADRVIYRSLSRTYPR